MDKTLNHHHVGRIIAKVSDALKVHFELKHVFHEHRSLEFNVLQTVHEPKIKILVKGGSVLPRASRVPSTQSP